MLPCDGVGPSKTADSISQRAAMGDGREGVGKVAERPSRISSQGLIGGPESANHVAFVVQWLV